MKNLKFRYAAAKNFMCFGDEGIELFFEDFGNIVLVRGLNLDTGTEIDPASNGAGKSSLQDIVSYTLYGKTVKRPKKLTHDVVINSKTKKALETEVQFDNFRVVRYREPNKLRIWESKDHIWDKDTEVTKGTMHETQKWIEEKVGLTHTAFCNVVVFDDSNLYSFLELDTPDKRNVIENLLGLDRYVQYHENAKELLKEQNQIIKKITAEYERLKVEIDVHNGRIAKINQQEVAWKSQRQQEVVQLELKISSKQKELTLTDSGEALLKFNKAQERIAEINVGIPDFEGKLEKVVSALKEAKLKLEVATANKNELQANIQLYQSKISKINLDVQTSQKLLAQLGKLEDGQHCPTCHGVISQDNYGNVIKHENACITDLTASFETNSVIIQDEKVKLDEKLALIKKINDFIADLDKKQKLIDTRLLQDRNELAALSKLQKPDSAAKEQVLESEIAALGSQLEAKKLETNGVSPYVEILVASEQELLEAKKKCDQKADEVKAAEKEVPYHEFWVYAFGDKGIRKYVVDGIIPSLNSRVAYWLQYLIGDMIQITFDNELKETITRNGTNAEYHAMSMGEKRRVNLAVSQAFAYVMMLNSGSCPSLGFLDEVTGGGIDKAGVVGIYNMIFELAKERQLFVTTHNQHLLDLLQGCESILLVKQNDLTKLAA